MAETAAIGVTRINARLQSRGVDIVVARGVTDGAVR